MLSIIGRTVVSHRLGLCAKEASMLILVVLVVPRKEMAQNLCNFCLPAEVLSQKEGANPYKDNGRGYSSG